MNYSGIVTSVSGSTITIELTEPFDVVKARRKSGGKDIQVSVEIQDKDMISDDQRELIFSLYRDIDEALGYDMKDVDSMMRYYFIFENGGDYFSLARNKSTKTFASRYIDYIIEFCFKHKIPFRNKEYYLSSDEARTLFIYLKYRCCFVCGAMNSDVAHVEAVGMGRNRKAIDHSKHSFMCLCRKHHIEQHQTGIETFMKKYHLAPVKLNEEQIKEFKIGG